MNDAMAQKAGTGQSIIKYAVTHGVTTAAMKFGVSRQYIYRWKNRYDGMLESLCDRSRRPHSHPNMQTPEETALIENMLRRNKNTGIVVL